MQVPGAFRDHRNAHRVEDGRARLKTQVLNAFRHHRNSHRSGNTQTASITCAQRLSASSEFAPWPSKLCRLARRSAERLSASSEIAATRRRRNSIEITELDEIQQYA